MLALIHTNRFPGPADTKCDSGMSKSHATLIVCPLNLISQWKSELEKCFAASVAQAVLYYGDARNSDKLCFARQSCPLVVITTYGTLSSEFEAHAAKPSPLYSVYWHRVVLDECHYIKERATKSAKACYALEARNRWAVSGTPIVNKLDDLFSLIRFIRVEPWCKYSFWNSFVTGPFEKRDPNAINVVQTILDPLIIRRTKDMKDRNGNMIVALPLKTQKTEYLTFSAKENVLYTEIVKYSKKRLSQLKSQGKMDYIHVFMI